MNEKENISVLVSLHGENEKSFGAVVDLVFDENGKYSHGSRLEWFPKSICKIEKDKGINHDRGIYKMTAPKWILDKKNIKYNGSKY